MLILQKTILMIIVFIFNSYLFDFKFTLFYYIYVSLVIFFILIINLKKVITYNNLFLLNNLLILFSFLSAYEIKKYIFIKEELYNTYLYYVSGLYFLWVLCFFIGSRIKINNTFKFLNLKKITVENKLLSGKILFYISCSVYMYILFKIGGIKTLKKGFTHRLDIYSGLGHLIWFIKIGAVGSAIVYLNGKKKLSYILICLNFLFVASFGGRAKAFFGILFPFFILTSFYESFTKKKLIVLGIIGIIFSSIILNLRIATEDDSKVFSLKNKVIELGYGSSNAYINMSMISYIDNKKIEYQYGKRIVLPIINNIIDKVIPGYISTDDKLLLDSGYVGKKILGEKYYGLPPGSHGSSYLNFGIIGIILFGILNGIISKQMYNSLVINGNDFSKIIYSFSYYYYYDLFSTKSFLELTYLFIIFLIVRWSLKIKKLDFFNSKLKE